MWPPHRVLTGPLVSQGCFSTMPSHWLQGWTQRQKRKCLGLRQWEGPISSQDIGQASSTVREPVIIHLLAIPPKLCSHASSYLKQPLIYFMPLLTCIQHNMYICPSVTAFFCFKVLPALQHEMVLHSLLRTKYSTVYQYVTHFIYPSIRWRTFGFFPSFSC